MMKPKTVNCVVLLAILLAVCGIRCAIAESTAKIERPGAEMLQAGDLLWPKPPEAIVPYNSHPGGANKSDEDLWDTEKEAYVHSLEAKQNPSEEDKARYKQLKNMTYQEFLAIYNDGLEHNESIPAGTGFASTGHVAIVRFVDGKPSVVEAAMKEGIRQTSYANWLNERPTESVWLGRLQNVSAEKRAEIGEKAASYLKKPYDFWNFNLMDDTAFYCSKLAWLCIYSVTKQSPDNNDNPNRVIWYSPKQLMNSPHVQVIFSPGSYGAPNR